MKNKRWILWILVTIALVVLALFIRARVQFSWAVFGQQLKQADWRRFAIAVALIYGGYVLRSVRWSIFLKPVKRVSPFSILGSQVIGFTGVALFGRLADLVRPYLVARRVNLTVGSQVAVYTVERMFDLGAMALIFSLTLLFAPDRNALPHHELMVKVAKVSFIVTIGLAIFAVFVRVSGGVLAAFTEKTIGALSPGIGKSVADKIRAFRDGLDTIDSVTDFLLAAGVSLAMWALIVLAYLETLWAFTNSPELYHMTLARCMVLMAASMGGSIFQLPVVGWFTTILATSATMHAWLGVAPEPALGAGAMLLIVSFLSIVPVGLIWSRFEHVSLKRVTEESEEAGDREIPAEIVAAATAAHPSVSAPPPSL
ncbi:putative dolichol-P-glucose synthetase [Acidisarcina polymorpha]|uniref:Putative dolichol-P-glucose synthetase n=1 Tax=Acidisarcina polymorpha TaxID=2211140 RepID=A0A2Z5FUG4_9BACT|nr:lysylphosphatidylglycerol synthase transmembrane domain-containing protein [Acidisarcina polymorpha]AXC10519.1 putative dolichol-P-glucose synthetase [Acidisarcina polymorpha]